MLTDFRFYVRRILSSRKNNSSVSFTVKEIERLKQAGLYSEVYIPVMSQDYNAGALNLLHNVEVIQTSATNVTPPSSQYYTAQFKIEEHIQRFDRMHGLEKRLLSARKSS